MRKLFRRKLTKSFIEKRFKKLDNELVPTYYVGDILDGYDSILIEYRADYISVWRGYEISSYWIADIEYIYQLRQLLKFYGLKL